MDKKKEKPAAKKIAITPELRRSWIRVRKAWSVGFEAFNHSISMLDKKQAGGLYDIVKHSLYKDNYAQVVHKHPELRELLKTDEDRLCMHDIYEKLSWRLDRREPLPREIKAREAIKGGIGRAAPNLKP